MFNLKITVLKWILNLVVFASLLAAIYFLFAEVDDHNDAVYMPIKKITNDFNVWLIFTKVTKNSPLRYKFHNLLENILNVSSVTLKFHIIIDNNSWELAMNEISDVVSHSNKPIHYKLYNIENCSKLIDDIVEVMTPHFSSKPGTYYSDALFYISLGLDRIAAKNQNRAVLLDCDLYFKKDIAVLFKEFDKFKSGVLFGLAPELTPVYRHVLHRYKSKHNTTFGEFYHKQIITSDKTHPRGFQGYNSGVVLIDLKAVRSSVEYANLIKNDSVAAMTAKYKFRGHLGDQDFYTLMGFERPHLIQTINCGLNRQLCTWWRDHGYDEVFDHYFKCEHPIIVLHGNCNTRIPRD